MTPALLPATLARVDALLTAWRRIRSGRVLLYAPIAGYWLLTAAAVVVWPEEIWLALLFGFPLVVASFALCVRARRADNLARYSCAKAQNVDAEGRPSLFDAGGSAQLFDVFAGFDSPIRVASCYEASVMNRCFVWPGAVELRELHLRIKDLAKSTNVRERQVRAMATQVSSSQNILNEDSHMLDDQLVHEVLSAIADGRTEHPKEIAKAALINKNMTRHYD